MVATPKGERIVITGGCHDCGGRCLFQVHVQDGVITRIETDDGEEPQLRACVRGRAYRQRVYAQDRLTSPLKRVGERGTGQFEKISWDEALDTVARELIRVRDTYGPEASLLVAYFGSPGQLHAGRAMRRLLAMAGGCSVTWAMISGEACTHAVLSTYGTGQMGNTRDDLLNSRLIILWGWNPANTIWSTNNPWHLMRAKEAGIPIICVDPRFTDTVASLTGRWIPIRPGTDSAMMAAMAFVMITENLHDQRFLDTYTVGFQRFKDYVLGEEDRVPKTPEWAEAICGVPAQTIAELAREYATTKPAALLAGFSPGRSAFGEQYHRSAMTLAAMTGNVGIHGGNA
ncbi:MAG: molybdopterin-dependent oxidoreductase, partial [Dehalococcoidia bacterium]